MVDILYYCYGICDKKLKFARTIENYLTCYHYLIVNASCIIKTYPTDFDLLLLLLLWLILLFGVVIDDVMITVMTK
ncbi:MAG: hypothetical protein M3249_02285 [Thermoproteota archaeon]|nr:hypothetical protein [Thermoproteota archaeon]